MKIDMKRLFESKNIISTLREIVDVNQYPEEVLTIKEILKYDPMELDKAIFDHYVTAGVITPEGKWDQAKLGDFYRNSPEDLQNLYDIVSETRYNNEEFPTKFKRIEKGQEEEVK